MWFEREAITKWTRTSHYPVVQERLELQNRQRDIAERNAEEELRQLKSSVQSLNRVCQHSETRELLQRVEKQVQPSSGTQTNVTSDCAL